MAFIEVQGGRKLFGEVTIQGSKNAVLPILAACILCRETIGIVNCPRIEDVFSMIDLLKDIGCKTDWKQNTLYVDAKEIHSNLILEQHTKRMRSSIFLLGSMLGRMGEVSIAYPGGCSIGARPIDIHLNEMKKMNVTIQEKNDLVACQTPQLKGNRLELYYPSVGATENLILCSVLAQGTTQIVNGALEPEIQELCCFLRTIGADITGDGTKLITIHGVTKLHGAEFHLVSDRIVAGTYLTAVAGTGGEAFFHMDCGYQLKEVFLVLEQMGVTLHKESHGVLLKSSGHLKNVGLIRTKPYPGFPTDIQSQIMALSSVSYGNMILIENVFEERFKTAIELKKMGADITLMGRTATIHGGKHLIGANVYSPDLRGGAALVIAGLMASGITYIHEISYIERGYEEICINLQKLGAKIIKVEETY